MKKFNIDFRFIYLFIPLVLLEIIFRFVQFSYIDFLSLIKVILFIFTFSVIVSYILTRFKSYKVFFYTGLIIVVWFCVYCFVELIFKNFMGDFYSFGTVSDGAARIAQYALLFLSNAKPSYYLCLIPIFVYIYCHFNILVKDEDAYICNTSLLCLAIVMLLYIFDIGSGTSKISYAYETFNNKDLIIDKLGITHFFFRDLSALKFKKQEEIVINIVEEPIIEEEIIEEKHRVIDDTLWKNIVSDETNENMKTIDNYLMSKKVDEYNDYTGLLQGKNLIYVLVESGDYLMIDKDLTPTLYKMYKEGLSFYNHYTPLYSCGTGESEFVSYTSIFPYTNTCTPNYENNTYFYEALPTLFKNQGYTTLGFHNWRDEWYERNTLLKHVGIDGYCDIDAIRKEDPSVKTVIGWQSDSMLAKHAWDHISNIDGNYFVMIISSTMHFPYNENSYYGDLHVKEVGEVHPDWSIDYKRYMSKCMEFDNAMKYLIDNLKSNGQLDDTVICLYSDHRPYWLDYDTVIEYTSEINKRDEYNDYGDSKQEEVGIYRSPFIIYGGGIESEVNYNYCSTMDHVPTLANLFGLSYDPRLYIGKDASVNNNYVIFNNGDWISSEGIYDASKELFIPKNAMPSDEYIDKINNDVKNDINISHMILKNKYFEKRKDICSPIYE